MESTRIRVVGYTLAAALAAVAVLQLYWAFGGDWGAEAASGGAAGDPSTGVRVTSALVAVVLAAAVVFVLARIGAIVVPLSDRVVHAAVWTLTVVLALATVQNATASTTWERYGNSAIALVLTVLSFVVARAGGVTRGRALPTH